MKTTVAAIEFGTSKVVAIIGELGSDLKGETIGYGVRQYSGYNAEGWICSDDELVAAIAGSIKDAEAMADVSVRELHVGVPAQRLKVHNAQAEVAIMSASQKVTLDDVDSVMVKAVAACAQGDDADYGEIIHQSPAWFKVDGEKTMEPMGMKGQTLSCCACVCVADKLFAQDMRQRFSGMGLSVAGFAAPSLGEALMTVPPEERDLTAVLIDTGYLSTQVMVVQGDAISHIAVLEDGSGFLTAALASELELTMAMAEQVKRRLIIAGDKSGTLEITGPDGGHILFENEHCFNVIEPHLSEMAAAIKECLENFGIEIPEKAAYYITGGGLAPMRGAREFLSARLGCTVKASAARPSIPAGVQFASAVGLLELVFEYVSDNAASAKKDLLEKLRSIFKK
jgi:cell division protein FtsA